MRHNAVAYLALFVALGGTSAYAANTIRSSDIIDNEVTTTDVRDDTLGFGGLFHQDLAAGSVRGSEVLDGSIASADIQNLTITTSDVAANTFTGSDIADNSLTGTDINESTLSLPPTTTATVAGQGNVGVGTNYSKVVGRALPAGSYAIAATANVVNQFGGDSGADYNVDTFCELRNPSGAFIGGGRDRRVHPGQQTTTISLSMNGSVQVPGGGGEVGVYCRVQSSGFSVVADAQMMIIRLDGFF
jgi:hypothetical protein